MPRLPHNTQHTLPASRGLLKRGLRTTLLTPRAVRTWNTACLRRTVQHSGLLHIRQVCGCAVPAHLPLPLTCYIVCDIRWLLYAIGCRFDSRRVLLTVVFVTGAAHARTGRCHYAFFIPLTSPAFWLSGSAAACLRLQHCRMDYPAFGSPYTALACHVLDAPGSTDVTRQHSGHRVRQRLFAILTFTRAFYARFNILALRTAGTFRRVCCAPFLVATYSRRFLLPLNTTSWFAHCAIWIAACVYLRHARGFGRYMHWTSVQAFAA